MISLRQGPQAPANAAEQLTIEMVERLAQETAGLDKYPKKTKGFKNIPTIDAITARYARTRSRSVDCTAEPPEAEPIEDPQTPGLMTKPPEHPLQHSWCVPVWVGCGELPISAQSYRVTSHLLTAYYAILLCILPVLQLAQAPVQARTQFKLSFVQVRYQVDVGG